MFYGIIFSSKNLEVIEKVSNFALAFEKHPTGERLKAVRQRPRWGRRQENKNKNFFEKVWKLRKKVINFATLFASGLPGRKGASDKNIESIYNRQVVQEKGSAAATTAAWHESLLVNFWAKRNKRSGHDTSGRRFFGSQAAQRSWKQ